MGASDEHKPMYLENTMTGEQFELRDNDLLQFEAVVDGVRSNEFARFIAKTHHDFDGPPSLKLCGSPLLRLAEMRQTKEQIDAPAVTVAKLYHRPWYEHEEHDRPVPGEIGKEKP
jgi:hypothetical protein